MVGGDPMPEDESCAGALVLRRIGFRTRTPNSLSGDNEGLEFFVPDPFPEFFGRFLPESSVGCS